MKECWRGLKYEIQALQIKMISYKIEKVLTYIPRKIQGICAGWNGVVWYYCHFVYGSGPKPTKKTSFWKEFRNCMKDDYY